jgi:hypothetical protein
MLRWGAMQNLWYTARMVVSMVPFASQSTWIRIFPQQILHGLLVGLLLAFVLSGTGVSAANDHSLRCHEQHNWASSILNGANCDVEVSMASPPFGLPLDAPHPHCTVQCSLAVLTLIGLLLGTLLLTARLTRTALPDRLQLQQPPLSPPPQTA